MEKKEEFKFVLTLPAELNKKIQQVADKEMRSRHAQIIYTLEELFKQTEVKGNGKTNARGN